MLWFKNGTKSMRREGFRGRGWRRRQASKKMPVPKGTVQRIDPLEPTHTHADTATLENAKAVTAVIVARDEHEAAGVHAELAGAQAEQGASQDELGQLETEQAKQVEHRDEYVEKVRKAGLGHKLVRNPAVTLAVAFTVGMAILFETISMSSPMALLSAFDFGGNAQTRERVGAVLAMLLALGYAVVLAVLSKRAGAELKSRHYRHLVEAEHVDDEAADDRPRTAHAVFADRMIAIAVVGGALALLAASVVREAAVSILAAAGQNAVQVSWWVFLALTMGVFIGLVALGYWAANPVAKVYGELTSGISKLTKRIDAKRRECYGHAARVDRHEKQLSMIDARSRHEQLVQLHLAAEEIAWRGGGNPHIYGVTIEPSRIQDVVNDPSKHVRDLTLPSLEDKLTERIEAIRAATAAYGTEDRDRREKSDEEHDSNGVSVNGPLENVTPLELDEKSTVGAVNGNQHSAA